MAGVEGVDTLATTGDVDGGVERFWAPALGVRASSFGRRRFREDFREDRGTGERPGRGRGTATWEEVREDRRSK